MFSFKKKNKNTIYELIQQNGIDHATQRIAKIICEKLRTKDLAYQFILEELEAASQGNEEAIRFVSESKIPPSEYNGAMQNSCPEVDGANGPQQFLLNISLQLNSTPDLMVEFRTKIVDRVMKYFMIGKYSNPSQFDVEKYIDTKLLIEKFAIFCLENGIHEDTYQKAYVTLINAYEATFDDPFNMIIEKTKAFNDAFNLVQRHAESECSDIESFIFMANAYSQRLGAFGEMLHGGIAKDVAEHFSDLNFKFAQNMTFHNKEFQELSIVATYELVKTVDYRINLDGLQKFMLCAISNKNEINFPYEQYYFIEWDDILAFFNEIPKLSKLTPEIINYFIIKNKKPNIAMRKEIFGDNHVEIMLKETINNISWVEKIITWANDNKIPDLELRDEEWIGLPREHDALLSLTELNLSSMNIAKLPEEFSKLIKLESLDISYNNLTKLPSKIGDLSNLKSLDIRCEKLYCVPDSIINLVNLRYLGFYDITHLCDSKLTHEFYMNWVYNLLKDGCDMSMGTVTDMSHIDEKCPPNIMYFRIDQDSWKRAPTRMEFSGGQVIETRYVESEDKFIRKAIAR